MTLGLGRWLPVEALPGAMLPMDTLSLWTQQMLQLKTLALTQALLRLLRQE
jgi:hypothetical protein